MLVFAKLPALASAPVSCLVSRRLDDGDGWIGRLTAVRSVGVMGVMISVDVLMLVGVGGKIERDELLFLDLNEECKENGEEMNL